MGETVWIPLIDQVCRDGEWRTMGGLRTPEGSAEWLEDVRAVYATATARSPYPDGHSLTDDEMDFFRRRDQADQMLTTDHRGIIRALLDMIDAA